MAVIDKATAQCASYKNRIPTPEPQSSSPLRPSDSQGSERPKRKATVTPRTFTRFFTPRSSLGRGRKIGASRQILRDITESASNRKGVSKRRKKTPDRVQALENSDDGFADISNKRKRYLPISPEATPDLSSPCKRMRSQSLEFPEDDAIDDAIDDGGDNGRLEISHNKLSEYSEEQETDRRQTWNTIVSRGRGPSSMAFYRELGETRRTRRPRYPFNGSLLLALSDHALILNFADWQSETSNFFSGPQDSYLCNPVEESEGQAIPFCTSSCNSKSFVGTL